jgi:DsrE/DsrF-like family
MSRYLLIASQDPFESTSARRFLDLGAQLAAQQHTVTVVLVENAVLGARAEAGASWLAALRGSGARVLADELALRERGIGAGLLAAGVAPTPIDTVIDELLAGAKALWS